MLGNVRVHRKSGSELEILMDERSADFLEGISPYWKVTSIPGIGYGLVSHTDGSVLQRDAVADVPGRIGRLSYSDRAVPYVPLPYDETHEVECVGCIHVGGRFVVFLKAEGL